MDEAGSVYGGKRERKREGEKERERKRRERENHFVLHIRTTSN